MKKIIVTISLLINCVLAFAQQNTYQIYCNSAYNYCIAYPSNLVNPEPEAPKGDGRVFSAKSGKGKITVWGNEASTYMIEGISDFDRTKEVKKEFEAAMEGKKITYKVLKANWFVISGTDENGNIFYQKSILNDITFINVVLEYPESEKAIWNPQCGRVANSLKAQ